MNIFKAIILLQSSGMNFYNIENELVLMMLAYRSCFREELKQSMNSFSKISVYFSCRDFSCVSNIPSYFFISRIQIVSTDFWEIFVHLYIMNAIMHYILINDVKTSMNWTFYMYTYIYIQLQLIVITTFSLGFRKGFLIRFAILVVYLCYTFKFLCMSTF